ncbi:hypothetical protein EJ04DRAFT_552251 [Polyplosphaeria fusca]|uniref:Inositol hexakisphosphate and diphosphoinositol-pentakisphosphate kinase n=1 Tax=Polyplosphaeria fusca TaxID=682080 RepID=A0A9P4V1Z1_9PLEO|nr:hypothetical protein EJ04DRAFT_552251 [Polyplosphaeria fusca]
MEQLSRTASAESTRSRTTTHPLASSSSSSSPADRKARAPQAETGGGNVERASVSMPPPASKSVPRQFPSRRSSKALDLLESIGFVKNGSAVDELETTPTLEGARHGTQASAHTLVLPDAAYRAARSDTDAESHRMSFSSLYSIGSTIYNTTRGLSGPSSVTGSEPDVKAAGDGLAPGTTTATSSLSVTTSSQNGSLGPKISPTQLLFPKEHAGAMFASTSPQLGHPQAPTSNPQDTARRSRSRTTAHRRISGSTGASGSPVSREMERAKRPTKGCIGVCALESKARSKPARNIFGKLVDDFEVKIFGDKIILDEDVENWPVCDFLISFFSDGFPLEKAIAYVRLRKPFCVNDLPMQQVLWDRRLCLHILDKLNVPTPKRVEVNRDGGPTLKSAEFARALLDRTGVSLPGAAGTGGGLAPPKRVELLDNGNTLKVDGVTITKPFVEKPVSGEDHNINIYFHEKDGGGGRRLFRKVNNKSSEKDDSLSVPRSITDTSGSYIYEQFLQVQNAEDVKAYTVGPSFCHAETRKSPVVDGLVKRNPSGKEVRYVTKLTDTEAVMATKISEGFGQRVCGFDLLRVGDRSFVIDVNGWSFVKDNRDYYDRAADILKDMFLKEIDRKDRKDGQSTSRDSQESGEKSVSTASKNTGGHRQALKGIFKSPSMSRLAGHHSHKPHILGGHQSTALSSSPDASLSSTPRTASPNFDKSTSAPIPLAPSSEPDLYLPPAARDKELALDIEKSQSDEQVIVPAPASKAQWKLKGVVAVVRHADRTPKQKFKYTFHTKPFVDLLKGHEEEVLLIGEAALQNVSDAVKLAMREGIEDSKKLRELQVYLNKKGAWPGTKVQIKPMFRKRNKDELLPGQNEEESPERARNGSVSSDTGPNPVQNRSDSLSGVTFSRISAAENNLILDKLQLVIKWGGEPTHSARHQAQDMGANFRNDLLLMNREILDDVSIFSSSERRSTTSAQIFASSFLEKDVPSEDIEVRKDLLDDSNAAKDDMDKVKKKLKTLLRAGDKAPPQFAWPNDVPEPYIVVRQVVDLMKFHLRVMNHNYKKIESGAVSSLSAIASPPGDQSGGTVSHSLSQATNVHQIQARWCCNEGPELFKERWEKLFREFNDADKVDPSKISELYDSMKFDALHNRQFLEWIFTPDAGFLEEETAAEPGSRKPSSDHQTKPQPIQSEPVAKSETKEQGADKAPERGNIAQRMGFRRRSEIPVKPAITSNYQHESYFKLYTGLGGSSSKAQVDARLIKLREMYHLCKVLFDYIGPQEYGIAADEKLEIGLLTSLPLLREIVEDLEEMQASDEPKSFFYFTKESHIYTLLNCILEGGLKTKIERNAIPELDYLSQIGFELYESENTTPENEPNTFNYSIKITLSPGCHAFAPLDVQLDSRHMIGFSPRRSLTAHLDWKECIQTLRAKFHTVKLPKSFVAINIAEKIPDAFDRYQTKDSHMEFHDQKEGKVYKDDDGQLLPPPAMDD